MTALAQHTRIVFLGIALLMLWSCGPQRQDTWNSYYYGTARTSTVRYPSDNDDSYVIPQGSWEDDQTPQGQIW